MSHNFSVMRSRFLCIILLLIIIMNDITVSLFCWSVFPQSCSSAPDPPLGSPTPRLCRNREAERREHTQRIDSKHNRMWYRVVFHSWTRVHTPAHYTLQYSHHRQAFKIHECGFFMKWLFPFIAQESPGLSPPLRHLCKFATRLRRASTIEWDYQSTEVTEEHGEETCASSPFTFYSLRIPARSSVSHVTSFTWWLALSFPQCLPATCRSLLLQSLQLGYFSLAKNTTREIVRWRRVRARALCSCVLIPRGVPLRLRCLLLCTGEPSPQSLHCWHSAGDVTRSPHSQHGPRAAAWRWCRR